MSIAVQIERTVWDAFQVPAPVSVSDWADASVLIDPKSSVDGLGGPWCTARTPYLREILDAFGTPGVEEIDFMAATQVGKTVAAYCMAAYAVDRDPGPLMYSMPDEKTVRKVAADRVLPHFRGSPVLARHMSPRFYDSSAVQIRFDSMNAYFVWSNSPAALASFPIRFVFLDEIDKYPRFSGREASPLKLASQRTVNFWNRKIVMCSTPTTRLGYIHGQYQLSDRRRYHVPCPKCGAWQVLRFSQVRWPDDPRSIEADYAEADYDHNRRPIMVDYERIKRVRSAWYECAECGERLSDRDKEWMLEYGTWVPEACGIETRGERGPHRGSRVEDRGPIGILTGDVPESSHRGYHIPSLYSPWVTFSDMAAAYLEAEQSKDGALKMNFRNSWEGEIWEEVIVEINEEHLAHLATDCERGRVPDWAVHLYSGVDVQADRLYYVVRAWGPDELTQLIFADVLGPDLNNLDQIIEQPWPGTGREFKIRRMAIDASFRSDEVYKYARRWAGRVEAVRGSNVEIRAPYRARRVDSDIDTGKYLPDGLIWWQVNTDYFKDWMARLQSPPPPTSPKWLVHKGVDKAYSRMVTSQMKIIERKGNRILEYWVKRPDGGPDHFLDAEVYGFAVATMDFAHMISPAGVGGHLQYEAGGGWVIGREST